MAVAQHLLIIEDDRVTALVISEYLASHGYRTTVATNGHDGIERFITDRPDLVLCDALLPRVNGFDACTEMRNSTYGGLVPIVMMSAFYRSHRQVLDQVPDLDVEGFLIKPFDLDRFESPFAHESGSCLGWPKIGSAIQCARSCNRS